MAAVELLIEMLLLRITTDDIEMQKMHSNPVENWAKEAGSHLKRRPQKPENSFVKNPAPESTDSRRNFKRRRR